MDGRKRRGNGKVGVGRKKNWTGMQGVLRGMTKERPNVWDI